MPLMYGLTSSEHGRVIRDTALELRFRKSVRGATALWVLPAGASLVPLTICQTSAEFRKISKVSVDWS